MFAPEPILKCNNRPVKLISYIFITIIDYIILLLYTVDIFTHFHFDLKFVIFMFSKLK